MLFLARAAVCIGLVAVAASHTGGPGLASALDRGVRGAADAAGQACLRSDECLRVGTSLLTAAPLSVARHEVEWEPREDRAGLAASRVPLPPSRPIPD
ncbi:MAG: hypothetical protein ACRYGP_28185 [Janthinobacterium lividum]